MGRKPCRRLATTIEAELVDGADDEDQQPETGPLRRCIVSRVQLPKEQMIRFVLGPERNLVPDLAARLPGRGMWLSASGDVLEGGGAKGDKGRQLARAFARAARGPVLVPPDLPVVLEAALIRRIGELLGLARRAGQAVAGFEKAREWVRAGKARLVVQACDGSEAERSRFLSGSGPDLAVIDPLDAAELGRIFGRDHAVHIAISPGRLGESLLVEAARLAGIRTQNGQRKLPEDARQESAGLNKEAGATDKA